MNIAVILASGSGTRCGLSTPKQFVPILGKLVIEYTLDVFENNANVDEIAVVCQSDYLDLVEDLVERNSYTKVKKILLGGAERYLSSLAAIEAYADDDANLIFHDAVRPLVDDRIINDCISALERFKAVDVAVNSTDTIIQVDERNCIVNVPIRSALRNGQTPQAFKRGVIKRAYEKALLDPDFKTTDDCGVVVKYLHDVDVYVVQGDPTNIKLTYADDVELIERLIRKKSK